MIEKEQKALEAGAKFYCTLPSYLAGEKSKNEIRRLLAELIDSLDEIEYLRSGTPLFDLVVGDFGTSRKKAIMAIEQEYGLTEKECVILRYLVNDRNPSYISEQLGMAKSTAKVHKYSIYKKLRIHSSEELKTLIQNYLNNN